jgi:ATP synthase protein I
MEHGPNIKDENKFGDYIAEKEKHKLKAMRENSGKVWSGLGMFGMVGWSVAVPTLVGAALGIWLDKKFHQSFSWTLTCLMIGLVAGSIIAWYWVEKEDKAMHQNKDENNE